MHTLGETVVRYVFRASAAQIQTAEGRIQDIPPQVCSTRSSASGSSVSFGGRPSSIVIPQWFWELVFVCQLPARQYRKLPVHFCPPRRHEVAEDAD
jgi:hypothetical protein